MYELVQVGERTYHMECPSKVGFYRTEGNRVVLIDSGSDKDAAKKVKRILDAQGWTPDAIYNTHSHADHTGGNQYLQNQYGCKVFARGMETAFVEYPLLEPLLLYGGFALPELRNKFLMAGSSDADLLTEEVLPEGLSLISLPGHCYDMVGFRTKDDVVFLADSLASEETLGKYKITYLYDVAAYIDTLEKIKTMEAACFVPAHAAASDRIADLAQLNIDRTLEVCEAIKEFLKSPMNFEELLARLFERFSLVMNPMQYVLVGSSVKSYLTYLQIQGEIKIIAENNLLLWQLC